MLIFNHKKIHNLLNSLMKSLPNGLMILFAGIMATTTIEAVADDTEAHSGLLVK